MEISEHRLSLVTPVINTDIQQAKILTQKSNRPNDKEFNCVRFLVTKLCLYYPHFISADIITVDSDCYISHYFPFIKLPAHDKEL